MYTCKHALRASLPLHPFHSTLSESHRSARTGAFVSSPSYSPIARTPVHYSTWTWNLSLPASLGQLRSLHVLQILTTQWQWPLAEFGGVRASECVPWAELG